MSGRIVEDESIFLVFFIQILRRNSAREFIGAQDPGAGFSHLKFK